MSRWSKLLSKFKKKKQTSSQVEDLEEEIIEQDSTEDSLFEEKTAIIETELPETPKKKIQLPKIKLKSINLKKPNLKNFFAPLTEKLKNLSHKVKTSKKLIKKEKSYQADSEFLKSLKGHVNKVNWKEIPGKFFAINQRARYHRYFQITLVFLFLYMGAKLVSMSLNTNQNYAALKDKVNINFDTSKQLKRADIDQIQMANIFRTQKVIKKKQSKKPKINENKICQEADEKSNAPVKLLHTIVLQDSVKSIASVQVRSKAKFARQGDKLAGQIKIDQILDQKLIVKNLQTGQCEMIEAKKQKRSKTTRPIQVMGRKKEVAYKKKLKEIKGIKNDGNNFTIEKSFINEKLKNINSLLTEARGTPIKNPDGTMSFKIDQIQAGGVFSYLGVENEDIINEINGRPIQDISQVMSLFGKIGDLNHLKLTIKRNGEELKQNYKIE